MDKIIKTIIDERSMTAAISYIERLDNEKKWIIEIKELKGNRSLAQNALLWMWLTVLGNELGYSKDEMYDIVVSQCWPVADSELTCNGLSIPRQRRTSGLNSKDFAEFLENIDRLAATLGCLLPHPNDLYLEALLRN